ncbi:MAG: hypothetical protein HY912_12420 [Desulfomonile tiedjei]|uniref:Uncharacterized protein n=1 Tax=Desulfomonile tiedjei TaxID=2358 RepID=A0A9D6Z6N9_9BACT|nr:hypothetical protein [Desulfomonile tiedjei]
MIEKRSLLLVLVLLLATVSPSSVPGQVPYQGQPPMMQPQPVPQGQQPPGAQHPAEYAFRPDLTNPQFGECLNLEKTWKMLWQRYAQEYQRARMMNPRDPQYAQMSYYLQSLKAQLDAAWQNFSSRCVYFPSRR